MVTDRKLSVKEREQYRKNRDRWLEAVGKAQAELATVHGVLLEARTVDTAHLANEVAAMYDRLDQIAREALPLTETKAR